MQPLFSRRSLLAATAAVFGKVAGSTFGVASGTRWVPFRSQAPCERSHEAAGPHVVTRYRFDCDGRLLSKIQWVTEERDVDKLFAYTPVEVCDDA
jgi:hypothetical protein